MKAAQDASLWRIFRWPVWIGLASAAGLVAALVGDGPWDALSWLLLAWPVALCLRGLRGRPPSAQETSRNV